MKEYEIVHEIFNECANNQMRDVFFDEIETDDPEAYIRQKFPDKNLKYEKTVEADGSLVFDIETGLFSFCGLMAKSLVIDGVIKNINLCKYFTIVCENPEPICAFIQNELKRGATIYHAEGAYAHKEKTIILTVMKRSQAVQLRNFIHKTEPGAFIAITNSSEIKGFRGLN